MISLFFAESTLLNLEELGFKHTNFIKFFHLTGIYFIKNDLVKIYFSFKSFNFMYLEILSIKDKIYY